MKKRYLLVLVLLIGLITITGCNKKDLTDAEKFKKEYETINNKEIDNNKVRKVTINKDNPIVYKEAKDIVEMIDNKDTFIVYFGFNDCPWWRSMVETMLKVMSDYNIDKLYYVDIKEIRDEKELDSDGNIKTIKEGTKDYQELLNRLDILLEEYKVKDVSMNEKRIYAPNVVAVTRGTPLEMTTGLSDDQKDPYQEITKEMKSTMYKKLECLAKCVNEASTTCKKNAC